MRKTLLTLLLVIIVTTLASCVLSPSKDPYAVKVVFTGTAGEDYNFDGTYYIKDGDDLYNDYLYILYTDKNCKTAAKILFALGYDDGDDKVYVAAQTVDNVTTDAWYGDKTTNYNGEIKTLDEYFATWKLSSSDTPFVSISAAAGYTGNVKLYANKDVVLKACLPK